MNDKESIPAKLADIVATFSDAAQQAGQRKAKESGFDLDAGEIPFEETLINLSQNREVLADAIKKGRISQLPLKLQYRLLAEATKVKTHLEALIAGTDAIIPFESAVEDLNATVWQLNLQNLSEQVLGFDAKMNELKNQEAQIKRILREASKISEALVSVSDVQKRAEEVSGKIEGLRGGTAASQQVIENMLVSAHESEQKIVGLTSLAETHQAGIAASLAAAQTSAGSVQAIQKEAQEHANEVTQIKATYTELEGQINTLLEDTKNQIQSNVEDLEKREKKIQDDLSEEVASLVATTKAALDEKSEADSTAVKEAIEKVDSSLADFSAKMQAAEELRGKNSKQQLVESAGEFAASLEAIKEHYEERFTEIDTKSTETIEKNDKEAVRLTEYLAELEARIHKSIERATGFSLFHAFQNRQIGLRRSALWWIVGLGACVLLSAGVSIWLIHSITVAPQYGPLFFMKLAISVPLVFAITFCSVQYSRERRLEEEYAFKSSISISLEPYRKLVSELIDKGQPTEVAKYTEFLIGSINRVFTSPTAQVFDGEETSSKDAGGLLKAAGSVAESLIKAKLK